MRGRRPFLPVRDGHLIILKSARRHGAADAAGYGLMAGNKIEEGTDTRRKPCARLWKRDTG